MVEENPLLERAKKIEEEADLLLKQILELLTSKEGNNYAKILAIKDLIICFPS